MARRIAALVPAVFALACERTGEVIVVLDSTMRGEGVEVVVAKVAEREPSPAASRNPVSPAAQALADSVRALDVRFRDLRDSLNGETALLDTADRRTRSYALRYADLRRAALGAEQVRAQRDSARTRLAAQHGNPADVNVSASGADTKGESQGAPGSGGEPAQRHAVRDSSIALSLPPGRWAIGHADAGRAPTRVVVVDVARGSRDTVRLGTRFGPARNSP